MSKQLSLSTAVDAPRPEAVSDGDATVAALGVTYAKACDASTTGAEPMIHHEDGSVSFDREYDEPEWMRADREGAERHDQLTALAAANDDNTVDEAFDPSPVDNPDQAEFTPVDRDALIVRAEMFAPGDRVRLDTVDGDGLPVVRYGFVGGVTGTNGPVVVMLDGEIGGDVVDLSSLQPVSVATVELRLAGTDLFTEPALRAGLVALWQAEADDAGLAVEAIHPIPGLTGGVCDSSDSSALAELTSGGEQYVVRAICLPNAPDEVLVRADRPTRYQLL
ncbi:MAG: hypothetical protein ACKO91_09380 [Acidimicrobiales bacterium]